MCQTGVKPVTCTSLKPQASSHAPRPLDLELPAARLRLGAAGAAHADAPHAAPKGIAGNHRRRLRLLRLGKESWSWLGTKSKGRRALAKGGGTLAECWCASAKRRSLAPVSESECRLLPSQHRDATKFGRGAASKQLLAESGGFTNGGPSRFRCREGRRLWYRQSLQLLWPIRHAKGGWRRAAGSSRRTEAECRPTAGCCTCSNAPHPTSELQVPKLIRHP